MVAFHPFRRLPAELRLQIWNLSLEPRDVLIGERLCGQPPTPAPPLLHACEESRAHVQKQHYTKFHGGSAEGKYHWVSLEFDTIKVSQYSLGEIMAQSHVCRHLVIEVFDSESFCRSYTPCLSMLSSLKTVTILLGDTQPGTEDEDWWCDWLHLMRDLYDGENQAAFHAKVVNAGHFVSEIHRYNYARLARELGKATEKPSESDSDLEACKQPTVEKIRSLGRNSGLSFAVECPS